MANKTQANKFTILLQFFREAWKHISEFCRNLQRKDLQNLLGETKPRSFTRRLESHLERFLKCEQKPKRCPSTVRKSRHPLNNSNFFSSTTCGRLLRYSMCSNGVLVRRALRFTLLCQYPSFSMISAQCGRGCDT
jgi:hypothetical protein